VVAAVAALNRLELAGESVRAALEALAAAYPDWLARRICVADRDRRYGTPMTSWRPPRSEARCDELAIAYARDGYALLEAVYDPSSPPWLRELPAVDVLRRVLLQNYTRTITAGGREVIKRREKEPEGDGLRPGHARIASPYDTDARRDSRLASAQYLRTGPGQSARGLSWSGVGVRCPEGGFVRVLVPESPGGVVQGVRGVADVGWCAAAAGELAVDIAGEIAGGGVVDGP